MASATSAGFATKALAARSYDNCASGDRLPSARRNRIPWRYTKHITETTGTTPIHCRHQYSLRRGVNIVCGSASTASTCRVGSTDFLTLLDIRMGSRTS